MHAERCLFRVHMYFNFFLKKLEHEEKLMRILKFNLVLNEHCGAKERWLGLWQLTLLLKKC